MGAWDFGPFDSDGALDALGHIGDGAADGLAGRVREVLSWATDADEYLEGPEASGAMAAAVLVAARLGAAVDNANARLFLEAHPFEVDAEMREHARRAFERVTSPGDNEWYELWEEGGALEQVMALHEPYGAFLAGASA